MGDGAAMVANWNLGLREEKVKFLNASRSEGFQTNKQQATI
jgi:hypothetical protein